MQSHCIADGVVGWLLKLQMDKSWIISQDAGRFDWTYHWSLVADGWVTDRAVGLFPRLQKDGLQFVYQDAGGFTGGWAWVDCR